MDNGDPNFDMNTSYDTSSSNYGSMLSGFGGAALGVGNLIGAVAGMSGNAHHLTKMRQLARKNFAFQQDAFNQQMDLNERQFKYQQDLNAEQRVREDNAYQRKVADLKAAGLNPILAAGGQGSSSAVLSAPAQKVGSAPQHDLSAHSMAIENNLRLQGIMADLYQRFNEVSQTRAQIKLINAQRNKAEQEAKALGIQNKYNDQLYSGKVTAQDLDNQLKSGVLQSKIDLESSKLRLSKKEELVKHLEFIVGQKESQLKSIEIEIQKLVKDGKITENQILDKKLELLTTECLQKALDYSNSVWDTDWYHARGLPNGFNAGWMGQLALLISGVGEKGANQLIDFFSSLFGDNGNGGSGRENSKDFVWKALKKATSYPSSKNSTWNSIQQTYQDYGVRRNH